MNLLINATPAKMGGAKSIVENYLENADFSVFDKVILLAPKTVECHNKNVSSHVFIETSGFFSWFFSVFYILWYVLLYRADTLISFNNVNLLIPVCKTKTYFHNLHIFNGTSLRFKLLRGTIKWFMRGKVFVFQSNYVKHEFENVFGCEYELYVNWCGCDIPEQAGKVRHNGFDKYKVIIPIVDINSKVKNFKFIYDRKSLFIDLDIDVISLDFNETEDDCFKYIGPQKKDDLFKLFIDCDLMIMPSLYETVGLPIFEFASTGKPVLVLNKPYLQGIKDTVGLTKNIVPFEEDEFEFKLNEIIQHYNRFVVEPLDKRHPLIRPDWSALS